MNNEQLSMKKNAAYDKASSLAIRIVNAYKYLSQEKKESVLSKSY